MEEELREAKAALEEALDGREKAALEAKLEETRAALEDAERQMRDAAEARAEAEHSLAEVKADVRARRRADGDEPGGRQGVGAGARRRVGEAGIFAPSSSPRKPRTKEAAASMRAMREKADLEDSELVRELKATHSHQIWEMEQNMRELELTMAKTHAIARENAERMMRHNERMGRVVGKMDVDIDIPVKFEIVVDTMPGQRVAMVGTWNDWELDISRVSHALDRG